VYPFGLFLEDGTQIGFTCFAHYSLHDRKCVHSNRVVVHPDYVGVGLGIRLATESSRVMHARGFRVVTKFTSPAMYKHHIRHPEWALIKEQTILAKKQAGMFGSAVRSGWDDKASSRRNNAKLWGVKYYWFEFRPARSAAASEGNSPTT